MKAKGWVVVKAKRSSYGANLPSGKKPVDMLTLKPGVWKSKPTVEDDEEAIELEIEFPDGYFDHNSPKVSVVVPKDQTKDSIIPVVAQVTKGRKASAAAAIVQRQQP